MRSWRRGAHIRAAARARGPTPPGSLPVPRRPKLGVMSFDARSLNRLIRLARRMMREVSRVRRMSGSGQSTGGAQRGGGGASPRPSSPGTRSTTPQGRAGGVGTGGHPGDYHGPLNPVYSPRPDGRPDPGEIVWTWVPYEEDPSRGKDRPVLLVGRDGRWLLGLMLTTRDRNSATRSDFRYMDIGSGPWDQQGRDSEVRIDRVLRIDSEGVRREGAVLDRDTFEAVVRRVRS